MAQVRCLACTKYERNCTQDCILAKVINSDDVLENVASNFGLDNFISLVEAAGPEHFGNVTKNLISEASQRKVNPVFGALGEAQLGFALERMELAHLRSRNQELEKENNSLKNCKELLIENLNQGKAMLTSFAKEQNVLHENLNVLHENLKPALADPQPQEGSTSLKRDHEKAFSSETVLERLMSDEPAQPLELTGGNKEMALGLLKDIYNPK